MNDVTGTITPGGPAQTITISTGGDKGRVTFDGAAGQRVSLNLTAVSISFSYVSIQKPNGAGDLVSPTAVFSSGRFIDTTTLPTTGTYTIYIDPQSSGTGSMTLTLYDVPGDSAGPIVAGGAAVTATTTTPGQNAACTFSGTQDQRVSLDISGTSLTPSGSYEIVSILKPDGTTLAGSGLVTGNGWIDTQRLPTAGTYTVLIDPNGLATGSSTIRLYDVPPDTSGSLAPSGAGDVLTPSTSTPGQNARLTFSGSQGQRVSLKVSGVTLSDPGSYEIVSILKPDGTTLAGSGVVTSSGWIDTQTLPTSGTYTALVDPNKGATSTSTITAYDVPPDFSGTLAPVDADEATAVITTVPGQDARLTFSGTAGDTIYLPRGGVSIPTSIVKILKPDGTVLSSTGAVGTPDGTQTATLPVTGTYTVLVDGWQDATGQMTLALSDEDAVIGRLSADQSDATTSDPDLSPGAPQPVTPTGLLAPGTYTTETWGNTEVGNDRGLEVVSSTDPGTFSVTGIVKDAATQLPIPNAMVTVTSGTTSVTATTDANGAYAVADVPAHATQISITPPAPYGSYQTTNNAPAADTTYEQTVSLTLTAEAEDDTPDAVDLSTQTAVSGPGTAFSQTRVPPTVDVRMLNVYPPGAPDQKNCKPEPGEPKPGDSTPYRPVNTYPFDYYLLRVAHEEIGSNNFNQVGTKAFLSIAQNFAWFHKTKGGTFDVDNSTNYQCFRPRKMVDRRWRSWLTDVLDERVATSANQLLETVYRAGGTIACSDSAFPQHGGLAAQLVIKGRSEIEGCPKETDWREIVKYFYANGTKVVGGRKPLPPTTQVTHFTDHSLKISFFTYIYSKSVAWKYRVFQQQTDMTWKKFPDVKGNGSTAPSSLTLTPAQAAGTHRYRVRAWNPVGWTQATDVWDSISGAYITG